MDYQVILSPSARRDIKGIVHYISYDAPIRAEQFGLLLISKTKILSSFPELGRVVPEFNDPSIREIVVRNYRIIYRVAHSHNLIEVIRYWHGARGEPEISS
jgi:addiction module RelE/StbE family toxin